MSGRLSERDPSEQSIPRPSESIAEPMRSAVQVGVVRRVAQIRAELSRLPIEHEAVRSHVQEAIESLGSALIYEHQHEAERIEQEQAEAAYPNHHPATALANYRAGREIWDSNGDHR